MPWRLLPGHREQLAQGVPAVVAKALGGPVQARRAARAQAPLILEVELAQNALGNRPRQGCGRQAGHDQAEILTTRSAGAPEPGFGPTMWSVCTTLSATGNRHGAIIRTSQSWNVLPVKPVHVHPQR